MLNRRLCDQVAELVGATLTNRFICGPERVGYQALVTPFFYPDRDHVELFLRQLSDGQIEVSDLGQTVMKLADYGFLPHVSPKRRAMVFQITSGLNIRYQAGAFFVLAGESEIGTRSWDLLLAIQKLSDLVFTVGTYTRATFGDEFENYIIQRRATYERGVQIALPTGYRFSADFVMDGTGTIKVVQLLSARSSGYARERANRVYADFNELAIAKDERRRIAVIDDSQDVWQDNAVTALSHTAHQLLYWGRKRDIDRVLIDVK